MGVASLRCLPAAGAACASLILARRCGPPSRIGWRTSLALMGADTGAADRIDTSEIGAQPSRPTRTSTEAVPETRAQRVNLCPNCSPRRRGPPFSPASSVIRNRRYRPGEGLPRRPQSSASVTGESCTAHTAGGSGGSRWHLGCHGRRPRGKCGKPRAKGPAVKRSRFLCSWPIFCIHPMARSPLPWSRKGTAMPERPMTASRQLGLGCRCWGPSNMPTLVGTRSDARHPQTSFRNGSTYRPPTSAR